MKIEKVLIESLILDPSNVRLHDDKNLEAIKGSLAAFGQQKNIVVDKNNIVIAGNGTLKAARDLGWKEVTINRTDLDGVSAVAFALADNRSAELASWDMPALGEILHSLREQDFDLPTIGFDTSYLDSFNIPDLILEEDGGEEKEQKLILTVSFDDDDRQQELFIELRDRGYKVKA